MKIELLGKFLMVNFDFYFVIVQLFLWLIEIKPVLVLLYFHYKIIIVY